VQILRADPLEVYLPDNPPAWDKLTKVIRVRISPREYWALSELCNQLGGLALSRFVRLLIRNALNDPSSLAQGPSVRAYRLSCEFEERRLRREQVSRWAAEIETARRDGDTTWADAKEAEAQALAQQWGLPWPTTVTAATTPAAKPTMEQRILDRIQRHPGCTRRDVYVNISGLDAKTAHTLIDGLVAAGRLEERNKRLFVVGVGDVGDDVGR